MSDQTNSKTPWLLVVSFALNGLLLGMLAMGLIIGGPRHQDGPQGGPVGAGGPGGDERMARLLISAAPEADRAEVREIMTTAWESTQAERETVRQARRAVSEAVTAADFDSAELQAEFEKWREADLEIKRTVQQALVDVVDKLPPESRENLGQILRDRDARREGRRGRFRERRRERRGD